jgi:hypothetical protein
MYLKAMEEIDVGYWCNWHNLFLLNPSQQLTVPSQPPVAKVPISILNKQIRVHSKCENKSGIRTSSVPCIG